MSQARLSNQAKQDLEQIWSYIAPDNPAAADRLIDGLLDQSNSLAEYPLIGRSREELRAGVRSFGVGSYLIFYRPMPEGIAVLRILHGARDLQALFENETDELFTGDEDEK